MFYRFKKYGCHRIRQYYVFKQENNEIYFRLNELLIKNVEY